MLCYDGMLLICIRLFRSNAFHCEFCIFREFGCKSVQYYNREFTKYDDKNAPILCSAISIRHRVALVLDYCSNVCGIVFD